MIETALLEQRLEDAEARLGKACDEIIELQGRESALVERLKLANLECEVAARVADAYDDLVVLHQFWKSAAERALRLWEAEAIKNEKLVDVADRVVGSSSTSMTHALWNELEAVLEE